METAAADADAATGRTADPATREQARAGATEGILDVGRALEAQRQVARLRAQMEREREALAREQQALETMRRTLTETEQRLARERRTLETTRQKLAEELRGRRNRRGTSPRPHPPWPPQAIPRPTCGRASSPRGPPRRSRPMPRRRPTRSPCRQLRICRRPNRFALAGCWWRSARRPTCPGIRSGSDAGTSAMPWSRSATSSHPRVERTPLWSNAPARPWNGSGRSSRRRRRGGPRLDVLVRGFRRRHVPSPAGAAVDVPVRVLERGGGPCASGRLGRAGPQNRHQTKRGLLGRGGHCLCAIRTGVRCGSGYRHGRRWSPGTVASA